MAETEKPSHSIKRIVLPSGKTIEVVHFYDGLDRRPPEAGPPAAAPDREPARQLHVCPDCGSHLVYPTRWREAGPEHWQVALRCPSCEWTEAGTFHQEVADRFDEELERGSDAIVRDLRRLTRANMAEEIDRFVAALEADAIQPMDF